MTIIRERGRQHIACDSCPAAQPRTYGIDDFDIMLADAREEGWKATRSAGEWQHTCPDCRETHQPARTLL